MCREAFNQKSVIWIFLCLLMVNGTAIAMGNEEIETKYYVLSVRTSNSSAVIKLNGIPLIQDVEGEGLAMNLPVNSWLMHGENHLSIELNALPNKEKLQPAFDVMVFLHDSASDVAKPKIIFAKYSAEDLIKEQEKVELPIKKTIKFDFNNKTPARLWSEAELIEQITADDKVQIVKLINLLEKAIIDKNVNESIHIQEYKIKDDAAAENKPEESILAAVQKNYEWLFNEYDLSGMLLSLKLAKFEITGRGKIVFVTRKDDEPAIVFSADDTYIDIPVYVAKIKNKWVIVR